MIKKTLKIYFLTKKKEKKLQIELLGAKDELWKDTKSWLAKVEYDEAVWKIYEYWNLLKQEWEKKDILSSYIKKDTKISYLYLFENLKVIYLVFL